MAIAATSPRSTVTDPRRPHGISAAPGPPCRPPLDGVPGGGSITPPTGTGQGTPSTPTGVTGWRCILWGNTSFRGDLPSGGRCRSRALTRPLRLRRTLPTVHLKVFGCRPVVRRGRRLAEPTSRHRLQSPARADRWPGLNPLASSGRNGRERHGIAVGRQTAAITRGDPLLLPRLAPVILVLQEPVETIFHPAPEALEAGTHRSATITITSSGSTAGACTGHPVHQLTTRRHPAIEALIQGIRGPGRSRPPGAPVGAVAEGFHR